MLFIILWLWRVNVPEFVCCFCGGRELAQQTFKLVQLFVRDLPVCVPLLCAVKHAPTSLLFTACYQVLREWLLCILIMCVWVWTDWRIYPSSHCNAHGWWYWRRCRYLVVRNRTSCTNWWTYVYACKYFCMSIYLVSLCVNLVSLCVNQTSTHAWLRDATL